MFVIAALLLAYSVVVVGLFGCFIVVLLVSFFGGLGVVGIVLVCFYSCLSVAGLGCLVYWWFVWLCCGCWMFLFILCLVAFVVCLVLLKIHFAAWFWAVG